MLASASMHKNLAAPLMAFAMLPVAAIADEPAKPPPPKWYDTIEIHGLVDAYYSANIRGPLFRRPVAQRERRLRSSER